jgi:hypothetical protein
LSTLIRNKATNHEINIHELHQCCTHIDWQFSAPIVVNRFINRASDAATAATGAAAGGSDRWIAGGHESQTTRTRLVMPSRGISIGTDSYKEAEILKGIFESSARGRIVMDEKLISECPRGSN